MRRLRLLLLGIFGFFAALNADLFRAVVSIGLCGLIGFSSLAGNGHWAFEGGAIAAQPSLSGQEIAIPPIIRDAPIDLQGSLADDFIVSRQTPYSSGRNEVLIVSPSTGTEQRFEISLPTTSRFRFYEASFSKVAIDDPVRAITSENTTDPAQVKAMLESFTISFDSNNLVSKVTLADGSLAEFSDFEAVIHAADGGEIERISLASSVRHEAVRVASAKGVGRAISQASSGCESGIRDQIYAAGKDAGNKSSVLRNAQSDQGKAIAWATTFSKKALEDSLIPDTRNQTLQEVACKRPVQCNQPQTYEGGSEIRTDLFQLPNGTNQEVELKYEFYTIPDRLELYYEGSLVFDVGPASGNATKTIADQIPDGAEYVGVKLIGNEDSGTKWWYTISCSGESNTDIAVAITKWENVIPGIGNWPTGLICQNISLAQSQQEVDNGWAVNLTAVATVKVQNEGNTEAPASTLSVKLKQKSNTQELASIETGILEPNQEIEIPIQLQFDASWNVFGYADVVAAIDEDDTLSGTNKNDSRSEPYKVLLSDPRPNRAFGKILQTEAEAESYLESLGFFQERFFGLDVGIGWSKYLEGARIRSRRDGKLKPANRYRQDAVPSTLRNCNAEGVVVTFQGTPDFGEPNPNFPESWKPYLDYVRWWHANF